MKKTLMLMKYSPLAIILALSGNSMAGWEDALKKDVLDKAAAVVPQNPQVGQAGQAVVNTVQQAAGSTGLAQPGSLTDLLVKQTGVSQAQAQGGAGALFQFAKSKMQADAFAKLEQSVPGMQGLLSAAPALQQRSALGGLAGSLSTMAGGSGGTAVSLISLASAFQQQGMSPQMVQQFIPVVVKYVQNSGGSAVATALHSVFSGL